MSPDNPAPENGPTITPEEAWAKLCGLYLKAARHQLQHSVVCPKPDVRLQVKINKRKQRLFRIVCSNCDAQARIPSEPYWFGGWDIINEQPSVILPG